MLLEEETQGSIGLLSLVEECRLRAIECERKVEALELRLHVHESHVKQLGERNLQHPAPEAPRAPLAGSPERTAGSAAPTFLS